jgi:DHA2 family multidrug resistance protein
MMSAPAAAAERIAPRRLVAFLIMVFGMFMSILDIQIVSASLNDIQAGLSASSSEVSWVQTAYLIAEVIAIPLSGFLSRALGTRMLFAISAAGFTVSSFLCGFASTIEEMIVWRALQGFLGAGMIPTVFASAYTVFPRTKFHIVGPIIGLVATLAPTVGPTVGGFITDAMSWHWLFFINIVPGVIITIGHHHHWRAGAGRFRPAEPGAARAVRLVGADLHGGLSRLAGICAGGGPAI